MAFYLVKLDGKHYADVTLIKHHHKWGPAALVRAITDGLINHTSVFDKMLFEVDKEFVNEYKDTCVYQDVDFALQSLKVATEKTGGIRIVNPSTTQVTNFRGLQLIKMGDLDYNSKYHLKSRIATINVCGACFVVLDHYVEHPSIVHGNRIIVTLK